MLIVAPPRYAIRDHRHNPTVFVLTLDERLSGRLTSPSTPPPAGRRTRKANAADGRLRNIEVRSPLADDRGVRALPRSRQAKRLPLGRSQLTVILEPNKVVDFTWTGRRRSEHAAEAGRPKAIGFVLASGVVLVHQRLWRESGLLGKLERAATSAITGPSP